MSLLLSATAHASGPAWRLDALTDTQVAPGAQLTYYSDAVNTGDVATSGEIDWTATLPAGITAVSVSAYNRSAHRPITACTAGDGISAVAGASTVLCKDTQSVEARANRSKEQYALTVAVDPSTPAPATLVAQFQVSGGGAATEQRSDAVLVATTPPTFGINTFDGQVSADPAGTAFTQAGGTPFSVSTSLDFNTAAGPPPSQITADPVAPPKDVVVDLPAGLVGAPAGIPQCTEGQLANVNDQLAEPLCPVASQVGTTDVRAVTADPGAPQLIGALPALDISSGPIPVFSMVPPPGVPARFGFSYFGVIVVLDAHVRSGSGYGLSIEARGLSEGVALAGTTVTFWGVPADPAHDVDRACPGQPNPWTGGPSGADPVDCADSQGQPLYTRPALRSFLRNPTSCSGPLTTSVHIDSWFNPGSLNADGSPNLSDTNWKSASFVSHSSPGWPELRSAWGSPVGVTGCAQVPFDPTISVQPTSSAADSPTGLNVDLRLPQTSDPSQVGEADLKRAVVRLPEGMAVNPSGANGLGACSSAQAELGSDGPASCPDNAKIGTVEIDTPLLSDPLDGSVYLAKQGDNPFGSLLAMYIVASGDGVNVKLPGRIDADPSSGQLTATFDNQPQLPFSDLKLSLFGGDRATLTTPQACGTDAVEATFDSWANPSLDVQQGDSFSISSGPGGAPCPSGPLPFAPTMSAGTMSPSAGGFSAFLLQVTRDPGDQAIRSVDATLPPGLSAKLAGVSECSDATLQSIPTGEGTGAAEAASPSCPANSLVGDVQIGVGAGTPYYVDTGRAYLAGPYKGAPYSLAIVTPALAGPFDLGNVVVRAALYIDPTDAHVTAVSDPVPTILEGIPLDIRDIRVLLDRPSFTINPTTCNPMSVSSAVLGTNNTSSLLANRFQVGNCGALGFSPKLQIALSGKGKTRSGDHPNLTATLTQPFGGQANIRTARVAIPLSLALDPKNSQHVCDYDTAQAVHGGAVGCPASTIIGTATAVTPLLDRPLTGNVYLVQGIRFGRQGQRIHTLPSLLVALRGQIALDLRADSSVNGAQQLVTTFSTIPDAAVSKFTLQVSGGRNGVLVITGRGQSICGKKQVASTSFSAQSGKATSQNDTLTTPCPKVRATFGKRHKQRHAKRHSRR